MGPVALIKQTVDHSPQAAAILARLEAAVADLGEDAALRAMAAYNAMLFPFIGTPRLTNCGAFEVVITPSAALQELLEKVETRNV